MDTQHCRRSLSYVTQKEVFRFLSIGPRSSLAQKCPGTREWHQTWPIYVSNFQVGLTADEDDFIQYQANLDGLIWTFEYFYSEKLQKVTNSKGKCAVFPEISEPFTLFSAFYLKRQGTQVHRMIVSYNDGNFYWPHHCRIRHLSLKKQDPFSVFLRTSDGRNVDHIDVDLSGNMLSWRVDNEHLFRANPHRKPFVKSFSIKVHEFEEMSNFFQISQKCRLVEEGTSSFPDRCRHLMNGKYGIGSEFEGVLLEYMDPESTFFITPNGVLMEEVSGLLYPDKKPIDISKYWKDLKEELKADVKFLDGVCGLTVSIDNDKELFISGLEFELDPLHLFSFVFTARVQENGKSVSYHQLSLRNKLGFWSVKENFWVLRVLTNLEISFVQFWHNVNLATENPYLLGKNPNLKRITLISKILIWCRQFHLLVLTVYVQALLSILLYLFVILYLSFSNPMFLFDILIIFVVVLDALFLHWLLHSRMFHEKFSVLRTFLDP